MGAVQRGALPFRQRIRRRSLRLDHPHAVPTDLENKVSPEAVPLPDYTEGELEDKPPHYMWARRGEIETSPIRGDYHVAGQAAGADFRPVTQTDARLGRAHYYSLV